MVGGSSSAHKAGLQALSNTLREPRQTCPSGLARPTPSLDLSLPVWATRVKTQEYTCCLMAQRTDLVFQSCSRTRVVSLDLPSLSLGFPECTGAGRT